MSANNKKRGVSRRTFLMGALASATAPAFFSSRGAWGAESPNERILLGSIGLGRQGRGDMQEAIHQGLDHNVRVVAVSDIDSKRLTAAKELVDKIYKEKAEQAGPMDNCATYANYREMLERKDLDGILVTSPDHWHALMAIDALKAGKDIYIEKPMTYSIVEGQKLVQAVRDNKRILQVGSQQRSSVYFRRACELVRNGRIGKLHTVKVTLPSDGGEGAAEPNVVPANLNFDVWTGPSAVSTYSEDRVHPQEGYGRPGWLQIQQYCHGMITGWGTHMNDIGQWGNGTDDSGLIEVEAKGEFPKRGIFDVHTNFKAEGKYSNGVKLIQETDKKPGVRFEGDAGWIFVSRDELSASDEKLIKEKLPESATFLPISKNHMVNWLESMRSRKDPIAPVEVGHRSNSVCIVTYISMKLGRKLIWDPKVEKFTNDEEANKMLDYAHREPWTLG